VTATKAHIEQAYSAFNKRDIDGALEQFANEFAIPAWPTLTI
jgi:hypothetical protein